MTSVAERRPSTPESSDSGRYLGFSEFYNYGVRRVVASTFQVTRDVDLAWDMAQDAFARLLDVWVVRQAMPMEQNLAFVRRIATNMAVSSGRRANALTRATALLRLRQQHRQAIAHVESDVLARDTIRRITEIPGKQQRAIGVLHFINGMTANEIADEMGISASTVRTQIQRLRQRLRDGHVDQYIDGQADQYAKEQRP
jgi:RNA polymerase sigma-70 factor (ECF subfamily)